ncbi:3',5'-cyclic-nucleotide phosphodiesterase regA [Cyphellophora attinorum]|uniref:Phosphodiesterase n=1 Tax=Cyphellophora attinorum TaxID=1664694 RepID=A0A0N1P2P9_9EURO|nr:3',5'-cyclic-nucleotide phosphodiesterase regA [Phialophora attinorum]KPI42752.1 3',5'-cyclic-nucleotide phosphodiesterase regA [Phialophora attinorum]
MDPSACRVIYIDSRFNTERWISRDGLSTPITPQKNNSDLEFSKLPPDLQANVNAFLTVFNQVFVCNSGRSFSTKLSELHDQVAADSTPIIACFDIGDEYRQRNRNKAKGQQQLPTAVAVSSDSPPPSPVMLRREITFSSESDESYGLQLLSRIASDLQVDESVQLIIPVAIVQPKRKDSYDAALEKNPANSISRAPYGSETEPVSLEDQSDFVEPTLMLQCLEAGAMDVVKSPLDKAGIMGLTVHAYRIYKNAKKEQATFMAAARKTRKASWVGVEEEKPYAYLREAMVKKLLKGICDPQHVIEDYQHRGLSVDKQRQQDIAEAVGKWGFDGHLFSEDELVYAGYYMLNHALQLPELEEWRIPQANLLRFMQGCRVAYNSFVLYHNFRHAVDVLQSLFYFLVQIGTLPPYPVGAPPPPKAEQKSPIARLLGPFQGLTLLISAIGHDVGHPGVNNMFLVKLNAPLAQLYNDQSVLEAFHCAAYSQILRRHWPEAFHDRNIRQLMIRTILATDMGVHADYMSQLGQLQERIHESKDTDGWTPKDLTQFTTLACGLLIKCADISNVARPWAVAEKWTYLLQKEFAKQGEMESAVGMETTLFGGPPDLGNTLKLANGQIGFMTIFAHPLFSSVADIIPAMSFAAEEILTNKGVWFTRAEKEKMKAVIRKGTGFGDGGAVSPRSLSPVGKKHAGGASYFPSSPLAAKADSPSTPKGSTRHDSATAGSTTPQNASRRSSLQAVAGVAMPIGHDGSRRSSAASGRGRRLSKDKETNGTRDSNGVAFISPNFSKANHSDPATQTPTSVGYDGATSQKELNDTSRDAGVSMRAGSAAIPTEAAESQGRPPVSSPLSGFNFATSNVDEPVRAYDPDKEYKHPREAAQSMPSPEMVNEHQRQETMAQNAISESRHMTAEPETLNEFSNTNEQRHQSEACGDSPQTKEQKEFEAKRARAASAPLHMTSPNQRSSFSVSSVQSGSMASEKMDYRSIINGTDQEGDAHGSVRGRKSSTRSIGRKRSKIKMGLMFWKTKEEKERQRDEDQAEGETESSAVQDEPGIATAAGGPVRDYDR